MILEHIPKKVIEYIKSDIDAYRHINIDEPFWGLLTRCHDYPEYFITVSYETHGKYRYTEKAKLVYHMMML